MDTLMGDGLQTQTCVPFVSQYTDCTEENLCSGCSKCTCTADSKWDCEDVRECGNTDNNFKEMGEVDIDNALDLLKDELLFQERKKKAISEEPLVPGPNLDDVLLEEKEVKMEDDILELMRLKRSLSDTNIDTKKAKSNKTIQFYDTVDEINEDTLKHKNVSGIILAHKIETLPNISRRTSTVINGSNLQIEYTHPKNYHHDDNKVDVLTIHDDQEDLHAHGIHRLKGNYTQQDKDKELSKLVVNELKGGISETIGNNRAPVISNITFTPENDTLTAMAFIAGNLLNKLWNLEKDGVDDTTDAETLKHEKITDLLELFKEPLNIRQELFLKNALEQLSTAIDQNKNVENISLCKSVEEIQKIETKINENKKVNDCSKEQQSHITNKATAEAFHKINDVLDLMKKYEKVQNNLINAQTGKISDVSRIDGKKLSNALTQDEKTSLDVYGKTLETITNLLIPGKQSKKVLNSVHNSNLFAAENDIKKKLTEMNLANLNVTTKDKMVLDYLNHIRNSPNCLLKKQQQKVSLPQIEGNILLNLSEFFKIKSLSDLVKLVEPEKKPSVRSKVKTNEQPIHNIEPTTETQKKSADLRNIKTTKEKLKKHLKSIIEDLMELQTEEGKSTKGADIKVMEALPCIYNMLNVDKSEMNKPSSIFDNKNTAANKNSTDNIQNIFNIMKKELKFSQTRRRNNVKGPRPKSAVVWERIIRDTKGKKKITRRTLSEAPKSMENLRGIMDKVGSSGSNTYKSYALLHEVPSAEKLMLLKTFKVDTEMYITILEQILLSLQSMSIGKDDLKELNEFVENTTISVNLNEKVVKNLDKPKQYTDIPTIIPKRQFINKSIPKKQMHIELASHSSKVTRKQIVRQFMKNRLLLYVQTKEATGETQNDINYDIARKALLHLELGNEQIAMALFEVLTKNSSNKETNADDRRPDSPKELKQRHLTRRRPQVEPLIKFVDPISSKQEQMTNQDRFIKTLLSFKNMF